MVGDESGHLSFLEDSRMDEIPDRTYANALALVLDYGGENMVSDDRYKQAARTIRFDHHLYTGPFTDLEVIDSSFESCCGMIALLAKESGLRLNTVAAKSLYTGMVTDSGRFRYDSTTARTYALASFLMETPFDITEIYQQLYADSFDSKKLKAQFTLKIRFTQNHVAYIYTTAQELAAIDADLFTVSRGMGNTMADIRGVSIWCNFTETENGVLCELRSNCHNINPIAVKYGGGGHAKASGATVADRQTAMAMLADLDQMTGEEL